MTVHYIRPTPDRLIEDMRPPRVTPDEHRRAALLVMLGAALFAVMLVLVVAESITAALHRPEACRHLTAHECTALAQEGAL